MTLCLLTPCFIWVDYCFCTRKISFKQQLALGNHNASIFRIQICNPNFFMISLDAFKTVLDCCYRFGFSYFALHPRSISHQVPKVQRKKKEITSKVVRNYDMPIYANNRKKKNAAINCSAHPSFYFCGSKKKLEILQTRLANEWIAHLKFCWKHLGVIQCYQ